MSSRVAFRATLITLMLLIVVAVIVCGRHIREAIKSRCQVLLFRRTPMERGHLWHRNYKGD